MRTDLFQSCGHYWVFQIYWHIECSTFFPKYQLLKRLSFPHMFLSLSSKIKLYMHWFISGLSFLSCIDLCVPFMPIPHCFDYYNCVKLFEIGECDTFWFVFSQDCLLEVFCGFYTTIRTACSISVKNETGILIGTALNLKTALGSMDITTILIIPVHEHRIYFPLSVSFQFLSSVSYSFKYTDLSLPCLNLLIDILFFLMQL